MSLNFTDGMALVPFLDLVKFGDFGTFIGNTPALNCACNYPDGVLRGWIVDTDTMDYKAGEI